MHPKMGLEALARQGTVVLHSEPWKPGRLGRNSAPKSRSSYRHSHPLATLRIIICWTSLLIRRTSPVFSILLHTNDFHLLSPSSRQCAGRI